jgi:hypothetical protein
MGELHSISPPNKPVTRLGPGTNMRCFREFWGVPGGAVFFSTALGGNFASQQRPGRRLGHFMLCSTGQRRRPEFGIYDKRRKKTDHEEL